MRSVNVRRARICQLGLVVIALSIVASAPAVGRDRIVVSPSPCVASGVCTVSIAWGTGSLDAGASAQLWVADEEGTLSFVACKPGGLESSTAASWIREGHVYEFSVFAATGCEASMRVGGALAVASVAGISAAPVAPTPIVGVNSVDLARQYVGTAYGGDGTRRFMDILEPIVRKTIIDTGNLGATFIRLPVHGFFPITFGQAGTASDDLRLWRTDPELYWDRIDAMMDELDRNDVRIVPVLMWNSVQLPSINGETVRDMVVDPNSASYRMLARYTREFIERYKGRETILFYELTNELNLGADLSAENYCARTFGAGSPRCGPTGSFSTGELIAFTTRFASLVRTLDPTRFISSGFAMPRPSAEHLRAKPEWSDGGPDWTLDTRAEFERNLIDIHQGTDLVSVHFYNSTRTPGTGSPRDNERFNIEGNNNTELLDIVRLATAAAGKRVFVGEFGDWYPFLKDDPSGPFSRAVLDKMVASKIDYASVWVSQLYSSLTSTHDITPTYNNVEQGYADPVIAALIDANKALGNRVNLPSARDDVPPQVVITWPIPGVVGADVRQVHVRAGDNDYAAGLDRVELLVDGRKIGSKSRPPYAFALDSPDLSAGVHVVMARAYDHHGNMAGDTVMIDDGRAADLPDRHNDILADFGGTGLWQRLNDSDWQKIHNASPAMMACGDLDGNLQDEAIVSFKGAGLWARYDNRKWTKLHNGTPKRFVAGDFDGNGMDDLVVDFGAAGVWVKRNNGAWAKLHNGTSLDLVVGDLDGNGRDELIVNFGSAGLWARFNGKAWAKLNNASPGHIATGDLDGDGRDEVIADFRGSGLWERESEGNWAKLHNGATKGSAAGDLDGNGQEELVADFGAAGLWARYNNSTWRKLHIASPKRMLATDLDGGGQADLVVDFGAAGLWVMHNNGGWMKMHPATTQALTAGGFD